MAARWSEGIVAEHRELQANAMAVDCTGQFAILAGKRVLAVVNLDRPQDVVKRVARQSRWEVGVMEWNPHATNKHLFVATSNQSADVWSWENGVEKPQTSLKAHTRVISDVNWAVFDANILATCSVDTYIYLWDIRDSRKPSSSLSAVAGAAQVKWNKVDSNYLATAHDGDIRIWDMRKGTSPVQYIAAHLSKIHGLDWDAKQEFCLATSSQDCTVKFWDVTSPRHAQSMLASGSPVWRARYTPFGNGLVTVVVPQLRRGENNLLLWDTTNLGSPVHTFVGHSDVVLEFQWRKPHEDSTDHQLVTWSRDHTLRLWKIDPHLQKLCGADHVEGLIDEDFMLGESTETNEINGSTSGEKEATSGNGQINDVTTDAALTRRVAEQSMSDSIVTMTQGQPQTLQQEFSLVNVSNIPNVTLEEMDALNRSCMISAVSGNFMVKLITTFPTNYPNNAAPTFQFIKPTSLDSKAKGKLQKTLQETSQQHVRRNRTCLEPCIRQLVSALESLQSDENIQDSSQTPYNLQTVTQTLPMIPTITYGSYQDNHIPFPRTSGARFCSVGKLVYFTRPTYVKRSGTPEGTPRSLAALGVFRNTIMMPKKQIAIPISSRQQSQTSQFLGSPKREADVSISTYYKERESHSRKIRVRGAPKQRNKENVPAEHSKPGTVYIYDIERILPIHKTLAQNYVLDLTDIPSMCSKNASVAANVGRKDLVQVWSLAALATNKALLPSKDPDVSSPWAVHPFGRKLLSAIIEKYSALHDVQTLAMLCCAFSQPPKSGDLYGDSSSNMGRSSSQGSIPNNSSFTTLPNFYPDSFYTSANDWSIGSGGGIPQSVSWSTESPDDYRFSTHSLDPRELEREMHEERTHLLNPNLTLQYDEFKKAYAKVLYKWDLKEARADILKYVSAPEPEHAGIEFGTYCQHCHREVKGPKCNECLGYSFQCAVCHIAVKGSSNFCLSCGHGGHSYHMLEWFQTQDVCPTGCGCFCLQEDFQIYGRERTDSFGRSTHL
ncbi:GATOR2 complex protein WDR59-like [Ptychodera flava]|uniref:GATOR2 complex protein WDR59-like n=1 Tax=Ptychodera flava TaxID=63121 RepID=UPI003969F900